MAFKKWAGLVLAAGMIATPIVVAQSAGQSMKDAGTDSKDAAKDTGHAVKKGTKKSYHATKHETKKGYHKTTRGTRNLGRRIEGKPTLPNNPQ